MSKSSKQSKLNIWVINLERFQKVILLINKLFIEQKTLVFDLDETLIRSEFRIKDGYDVKFYLNSRLSWTGRTPVFLYIRPYVYKMLQSLKNDFELIVFTASVEEYANKILKIIDKDQVFDHVLYRDQCINNEKLKVMVKDLELLLGNRDLKDIVIIDNKATSYLLNIENGIPIKNFVGDKSD